MNSMWPDVLASLDQSLSPVDEILAKLHAAQPIDVAEVSKSLRTADEHARKLRDMLQADAPNAEWTDHAQLAALVAELDVAHQRSRLRSLADELQRGNIAHRRAARVQQLSELRDHAVNELRSLADQTGAPPTLPGPEAAGWVEWACSLKEPEDAVALQSLREGFLYLDEFVASLEPGMWGGLDPAILTRESEAAAADEERRAQMLALASELERGNIVHHRGIRVTQVNQLRETAVTELRSLSEQERGLSALPGPDAAQWVPWASNLKEPDDAEELKALRSGFPNLDEFVANLEPEMWVAPSAQDRARAPEPVVQRVAEPAPPQREPAYTRSWDEPVPVPTPAAVPTPAPAQEHRSSGAAAAAATAPALESWQEAREEAESFYEKSDRLAGVKELLAGKRGLYAAGAAVLLVVVLGAVRWKTHHTQANIEVAKPVEASTPAVTPTPVALPTGDKTSTQPATSASSNTAKPKANDANNKAAQTPPTAPAEKQPVLLEGASLKTPEAMPKKAAPRPDDAAPPQLTAVAGSGTAIPGAVMNMVKSVPTTQPKMKPSGGVAEGQIVKRVAPVYPSQARNSGIQGTVTLQALIGKDGKVQSVKIVKGPAMLTQAAVDAVKQWQYKPFLLNGEPAEAEIPINVNFTP
jgi:protein TonB